MNRRGFCFKRDVIERPELAAKVRYILKYMARQRLACSKCGSNRFKVRDSKGLERLMIWLTKRRRYRCLECENTFRAADRRQSPRNEAEVEQVVDARGGR
jgi:hypothetical protein